MSVLTKIILDTAEYNRLLSIEKAYNELKAKYDESSNLHQSGSGTLKNCTCLQKNEKCECSPSLSEIIAKNEQARVLDIPPRGILPSITDPNEKSGAGPSTSIEKEIFEPENFRSLADDKSRWYFLGHYEEK